MHPLNYESPDQRRGEPGIAFPSLLRYLVLFTAAVEFVMLIYQFYLHVKYFNPNSPIAPGRSSDARGFIAMTLAIIAMMAFLIAQLRDPQVWQAVAYMVFNLIGVPFPFAHHLGRSMAGMSTSLFWTLSMAGWLAFVGILSAIYAYHLRRFERAGANMILSEMTSQSLGTKRSVVTTRTTTVTIIRK